MDHELDSITSRALAGDRAAAFELVSLVPESARGAAKDSFSLLSASALDEMLREPAEFMSFKAPEMPAVVDPAVFRCAIDCSYRGNKGAVREALSGLDLAQLFTVVSTAKQLCTQLEDIPLRSRIAIDVATAS